MEAIEIKVGKATAKFGSSVAMVSASLGEHGLHVIIYVNDENMRRSGQSLWLTGEELAAFQQLLMDARAAAERLAQLTPPRLPGR